MKIEAKILKVLEPKSGIAQSTGNPYYLTDMLVTWEYREPGCNAQIMEAVATVSGEFDTELINKAVADGKLLTCLIYFNKREYQGKYYNSIKLILPDSYMKANAL